MVFDTLCGLHGARKTVVKAVFARCTASLLPAAVGSGRRPEAGSERPAGPLSVPAAGGLDDGVDGDTGMVGRHPARHPRPHGGGQPAVVGPPSRAGRCQIPALASLVSPLTYCSH